MSNLASDTFTGTNGAAWSSTWTTGINPSAGAVTPSIQNNRGRLTTGSAGSYAGGDRISRLVNIVAPVDAVAIFSFIWTTGDEAYPAFYIRSTNTALDGQGGYFITLNKGANTYNIGKGTSYSNTNLGVDISKTWVTNTKYWCRFGVVGSAIKARVWNDGSPEPSTWDFSTTDTTYTTANSGCGFTVGGGALGSRTVDFDDFSLDTTFPATPIDGTSTFTIGTTASASTAKPVAATSALTTGTTAAASSAKPVDSAAPLTISATASIVPTRNAAATSTLTVGTSAAITSSKVADATSALTIGATASVVTSQSASASSNLAVGTTATAATAKPVDATTSALTLGTTASTATAKPVDSTSALTIGTTSSASVAKPVDATSTTTISSVATIISAKSVDASTGLTIGVTATASITKTADGTAPLTIGTAAGASVAKPVDSTTPALTIGNTATASTAKPVAGASSLTIGATSAASLAKPVDAASSLVISTTASMQRTLGPIAGTATNLVLAFTASLDVLKHTGSWYQLISIYQQNVENYREDRTMDPVACPNDGEPLKTGPQGELYCPFDGWKWNGRPLVY